MAFGIKSGEFETSRFQLHVIDYQASAFHMEDFHDGASAVYEDKNITILNVTPHLIGNQSAQCIKTFPHIGWPGVQVIGHRWCKAKHWQQCLIPVIFAALQYQFAR